MAASRGTASSPIARTVRAVTCALAAFAGAAACDASFAFDMHGGDGSAPSGPCAADVDCPLASLQCDLTSGACVPCTDDAFCTNAGFPRCDTALHLCVECGSSQDCQNGFTCSESHRCVPACLLNAQCPASAPTCNTLEGHCAACSDDTPCPSGVCDHESGKCVECRSDSQCAGRFCQRAIGRCVDCVLSSQCPSAASVCDPATWTCVP